jgi:hypothetical protein
MNGWLWIRSAVTDSHDEFDTGRIIAPVAVFSMIAISASDVLVNHAHFDAQGLGVGIGSVLVGLAGYLYGDAKHPPSTGDK